MTNEKDILLDINKTIHDFLLNMYNTRTSITNIKKHINELDNNYFTEDKEKVILLLLTILDDTAIEDLTQVLLNYKNIVENKLNNICSHEWITDEIDINYDRSQKITYCRLCEVSKKM